MHIANRSPDGMRFFRGEVEHVSEQPSTIQDVPLYSSGNGNYEWPVVVDGSGFAKTNLLPQTAIDQRHRLLIVQLRHPEASDALRLHNRLIA